MTRTTRRVGIVLFQLGGPDTLEAIEPFLYNLFCDPDIIDFPFARIGRKPLAKLMCRSARDFPICREPECSMIQTAPSVSRHSSMK